MNMGLEQYKYFIFYQFVDEEIIITDEKNGIGLWMILQAEYRQEAWTYLMELGKGVKDYEFYETVEKFKRCGNEITGFHIRWDQFYRYKEVDLKDGVALNRLILAYEPSYFGRNIKGFIHKINGDFMPFYNDVNFTYPFCNSIADSGNDI